ncbi:MAG TPA: hypothetical protein VFV07_01730 [Rhizomicrobium sp.]|nr:hypothetical protein [Rhizomicrobium sp.]
MGSSFKPCLVFGALALSGCVSMSDLPTAQQAAVQCAARELTAAPGVQDVKVYPGHSPIVGYTFMGRAGKSVRSRVRIDGWAAPGKAISYYYQIIDDEFMQSGSGHSDVRDLMSKCDLGQTVVMD